MWAPIFRTVIRGRMTRVAQYSIKAFGAALAAVAVLSIMDALMKYLVLAIGIVAVSLWRACANLAICPAARGGRAGARFESTSRAALW